MCDLQSALVGGAKKVRDALRGPEPPAPDDIPQPDKPATLADPIVSRQRALELQRNRRGRQSTILGSAGDRTETILGQQAARMGN